MDSNLVVRFYRLLLTLYPAAFRERLGEEMVAVFAEAVAEARQQGGPAPARVVLRELLHFPGSLLMVYGHGWQQLEPAPINAPGLPWIAGWTLLSNAMLPFAYFLMAPLAVLYLFLLELLPGLAPDPNVGEILGFVTAVGFATALVQWLLLRPHLAGAGWWIPLTMAGWLASGLLAFIVFAFIEARILGPAPIFLLAGFTIGLAQWLLLRRLLPGSGWWLPASMVASSSLLLVGESFGSFTELVVVLMLPYLVTGAILWLLLQRSPERLAARTPVGAREQAWAGTPGRPDRRRLILLALLLLIPLLAGGPWAYAVAHLELAKREGIYPSPEEAIRARAEAVEGVQVERIQMMANKPNSRDGSLPHVWFAGANITYDRPPAYTDRRTVNTGSYYIKVEEGWVHVGEGAFPPLIGRLMEIYHLEGVGGNGPG